MESNARISPGMAKSIGIMDNRQIHKSREREENEREGRRGIKDKKR